MLYARYLIILIPFLSYTIVLPAVKEDAPSMPESIPTRNEASLAQAMQAHLPLYLKKISLTQIGIENLYTYLNHPNIDRLLSRYSGFATDLLSHTATQQDPYAYIISALTPLHVRMKGCRYLNPTSFVQFLDQLPAFLGSSFSEISLEQEEHALQEFFEEKITTERSLLENNPKDFAALLAQEVSSYIDEILARANARNFIVRYLESNLSKLGWDPLDEIYTWQTFTLIGNHIELLYGHSIIPEVETAHHLLWSLVYQFCYFLDLWGATLPLEFYEKIQKDLDEKSVSWLFQPESDQKLRSKSDELSRALDIAKTRAAMYVKHNIVT